MRRLNRSDVFALFFLLALFVYVIVRSVLVDITNDEAYSFYIIKNFWYAEALCTGNTHWLNSLAIKLSVLGNMEDPWQLRWLSTFSTFMFFMLAFVWIRSLQEFSLKIFILALLLNPYILDYLSLARGYASGLMLQGLSLCFFFAWLREKKSYQAFLTLFIAGLCPLANFSFVYFFLAISIIYFFQVYFADFKKALRSIAFYRDGIYVSGISFLVLRSFVFISSCSNDVVGAGTENFSEYFHVMLQGLAPALDFKGGALYYSALITFVILLLSCFTGIYGKEASQNKIYYFCSLVLLLMLSATLINGFFFGVVFPYYRSAIFLFPASLICFVYFLDKILKTKLLRKIIFYGSASLLILNFTLNFNLRSVYDYRAQADSRESFDLLELLNAKNVGMSREVYGVFRNYYQVKENVDYNFSGELIPERKTGKDAFKKQIKDFDYLLLAPPYKLNFDKDPQVRFNAVKYFSETGTLVLKVN